jgi:hypothetical protein
MNYLKNLKLLSILFLFAMLIVSCTKENVDGTDTIPGEIDPPTTIETNDLLIRSTTEATEDGCEFDCFVVNYPFDLIDINDQTYTINEEGDWYELFEDSVEIIDFVYPLNITYEDGTTDVVANGEELGEAFASCLPNEWNEDLFPAYLINDETSCFNLSYPLDVIDLEDNVTTVNDEEEFIAAIANDLVFFVFPFDLINEDGDLVTVENYEDLLNALFSCNDYYVDTTQWDSGFEYIGCYQLTFPFDLELYDGTVVTVTDHMQYCDLLLQGNVAGFAFPLSLIDENGDVIIVNSQEELDELLEECGDWPNGITGDAGLLLFGSMITDSVNMIPCYSIVYPIDLTEIDEDGNPVGTVTVADEAAYMDLINSGLPYNVNYPVTIIWTEGNEEIEIIDTAMLAELLSTCF